MNDIRKKYQVEDIISRTIISLWRYLPLLPVKDPGGEGTPLRSAGWTPIYTLHRFKKKLGCKISGSKMKGKPTASFKDRASAVVVARAREIGAEVVVTASTGNAGAALAGCRLRLDKKRSFLHPKQHHRPKLPNY